jgi:hypothetical protein
MTLIVSPSAWEAAATLWQRDWKSRNTALVEERRIAGQLGATVTPNRAFENGRSQASLRSLARAVQRGRYANRPYAVY